MANLARQLPGGMPRRPSDLKHHAVPACGAALTGDSARSFWHYVQNTPEDVMKSLVADTLGLRFSPVAIARTSVRPPKALQFKEGITTCAAFI